MHKKAHFVVWWIHRKISFYTQERIQYTVQSYKEQYEELMMHLLSVNWHSKSIASFFNDISKKQLSFCNNKYTIKKIITSSHCFEVLFQRIKSDFRTETTVNKEEDVTKISKLIHLRFTKEGKGSISRNYTTYLSRRISPNVKYFEGLKRLNDEFNFNKTKKRYLEQDTEDLFNLLQYYKCSNEKKITHTKVREIYQRDMLLIDLAKDVLTHHLPNGIRIEAESPFVYTVYVTILETDCCIVLNGEHQRKWYNYLHQDALKNIVKQYWLPINQDKDIPLHNSTEIKNDKPRSFFDCVQKMEQERRFLIESFLIFEKEKYIEAKKQADMTGKTLLTTQESENDDARVELRTLLTFLQPQSPEIEDILLFRNYAFHQVPLRAFSEVPEPIQTIFKNKIQERERKINKQKIKNLQNRSQ